MEGWPPPVIYLDTHVVLWLYEGLLEKFSTKARELIDGNDLLISPMVRLELEYMHEIHRCSQGSHVILGELQGQVGLSVCDLPFDRVARKAVEIQWTRDPFDRMIVAHAACRELQLLTKDASIGRHAKLAVWN
jgi:PIN domain nuclease of toxin-antitoxin system